MFSGRSCIHRMDPACAFSLSIRMETTILAKSGTKDQGTGFTFPLVIDVRSTFNSFRDAVYAKYPWGLYDAVEFRYWEQDKFVWIPLQCDSEIAQMFASNALSKTAKIEATVIQRARPDAAPSTTKPPAPGKKSKSAGTRSGSSTAAPSSSCHPPGTPSANVPPQPGSTDSHTANTSSQLPTDPIIEEAEPDDVLGSDEEDERMFPDLLPRRNVEQQDEDYIPAEFSDTDSEEEQENIDMGCFENDDEDMPEMLYDRDNPSLAEGVVFPSAVDCRNAVATFSIKNEVEYKIEHSDPSRFTVYCAFPRCRWRLHASLKRNSTLFQVLTNNITTAMT
jgi:hypothetical protein